MKDIITVQREIRQFKQNLNSSLSEQELGLQLCHLCGNGFSFSEKSLFLEKGFKLYRARPLKSKSLNELKNWNKNDFWAVPKELVKSYGRLNRPNESIFYLSNNLLQSLNEIRFNNETSNPVVISCFEVKKKTQSIYIGGTTFDNSDDSKMTKRIAIQNLYADFFGEQFSKPVGKGTEYLYKLSNAIYRTFFDLPPQIFKAWTYPAVENPKSFNIAFRPLVAPSYIEYKGAIVIKESLKAGFKIPICFDKNYNAVHADHRWIDDTFNLNYKKYV